MKKETEEKFRVFERKMIDADLPSMVIRNFKHYFAKLLEGDSGKIHRDRIDPVDALPVFSELEPFSGLGRKHVNQVAMIKLNGGLGTSMGMQGPKSMLPVKQDMNFLDIILRQSEVLATNHGHTVPVCFMDSKNTSQATLEYLMRNHKITQDLPLNFLQHRVPKVDCETLLPAEHVSDPELEWAPPGHGDIYYALIYSGLLNTLREAGKRYLFVSNADNLGAVFDFSLLGYIIHNQIPFLMETARRTESDKKGGHLARLKNGALTLREVAQCPEDEKDEFEDISKYKFFNTNTIWIDLEALSVYFQEHSEFLDLPLIRNEKNIDPTDPDSKKVFQIETAMGAAISKFKTAEAVEVPRTRFRPVKTCEDLVGLWSDAYYIDENYILQLDDERTEPPQIKLDKNYYKLIEDVRSRFPYGSPSLKSCSRLQVNGDVVFGKDVTLIGDVGILNSDPKTRKIPDGTVIKDKDYRLS